MKKWLGFVQYFLIVGLMFIPLVQLQADLRVEHVREQLEGLLHFRRSIKSLELEGEASRSGESPREFKVWMSGDSIRTDLEVPGLAGKNSYVERESVEGSQVRRWQSEYGAIWEASAGVGVNRQFNLRSVGLTPMALIFFDLNSTISDSLIGQMLEGWDDPRIEEMRVQGQIFIAISVKRGPGERNFALFDKDDYTYRGCQIVSGEYINSVVVGAFIDIEDGSFPSKLRCIMTKAGDIIIDESVEFTTVSVNGDVPEVTFQFSGMGVKEGDSITVRDGLLGNGNSDSIVGVFSNGRVILQDEMTVATRLSNNAQTRMRRLIIAANVMLLALGLAIFVFWKRFRKTS